MLKKIFSVLLLLSLLILPNIAFAESQTDISAECAVLMNADTGEVIFEKNPHKRHSMASTTKIMTSIIALEQFDITSKIKITDEMVLVEGTSMGLKSGDVIDVESLIYGMLLESGNDAANAVAYAVSGSIDKFSVLMNQTAHKIGMKESSFVTPSGLDSENHFSTAYDMALLGSYALNNKTFKEICSQKNHAVTFGSPESKINLHNHNRMLSSYDGAIGIKTGFTKKSGRCLVSAAQRSGVTLVCVTLNAPDDWNDASKLLDYGFSTVQNVLLDEGCESFSVSIINGKSDKINLVQSFTPTYPCTDASKLNITKRVYLKRFEYAPVKSGDILGYSCYYNNDELILKVPLIAGENVEQTEIIPTKKQKLNNRFKNFISKIKEHKNGK